MKRVPISPYGVSKLAGESYMQAFYEVYDIKTTCLRYFNVYGPRQKDSPYSGVIAIWLGNIVRNENPIIFGDGKNSRDFTYIKDVVDANLLAAYHDVPGEIFNIGAGSPISLNNLADLMLKITGKGNLQKEYTAPRPGDILHSYADIAKAKELLKFNPKYNQEQGLKDYISWYSDKYNIKF
jgi:UDP-glucose 4-epimerase